MQQKKGTVVKKNCKKIKLNWILKNSNQQGKVFFNFSRHDVGYQKLLNAAHLSVFRYFKSC